MAGRWNGWGDRYDAYGVVAGLPTFLILGSVFDFGLGAGPRGWLLAFPLFAATTNVTSYLLRRRGPDGAAVRRHVTTPPRAFAYSGVMAAGAVLLGWGVGVSDVWIAAGGLLLFAAGATALTRLKRRQIRAFRAELAERAVD